MTRTAFICALALALAMSASQPGSAQTDPPTSKRLADAIAEASRSRRAAGAFHRQTVEIEVQGGPVRLASTPDGRGALRTDDLAELEVLRPDGTLRRWRHDFRDRANGVIRPIAPVDVSELFDTGAHVVTLTLVDVLPPLHSTSAYYLIYFAPDPAGQVVGRATPPTPVPSPTAASARATRAAPPTLEPLPTGTTSGAIVSNRRVAGFEAVATPTASAVASQSEMPMLALDGVGRLPPLAVAAAAFLAAVVAAIVLAAIQRSKRAAAASSGPVGIAHLYDVESHAQCENVDLTQFAGPVAVTVNPLAVVPMTKRVAESAELVAVLERDGEGGCAVRFADQRRALRDLDEVLIGGRVRLEYRAPTPGMMSAGAASAGAASAMEVVREG